jgi:hypothetical protein
MRSMSCSRSGLPYGHVALAAFGAIVLSVAGCVAATASPSLESPTSYTAIPSAPETTSASATPTRSIAPSRRPPGKFVATGSMTVGRDSHTATLLLGGRVLIAGGSGSDAARSAELYDPVTGTFKKAGSLNHGRVDHTATLLKDGRVLIAGGIGWADGRDTDGLAFAELYDPATGKFSPTGSMTEPRVFQTATLLLDGRVLITGGRDGEPVATAELYDPSTGTFSAVGRMTRARMFHTATLLQDGRVLIAGGIGDSSAELYDPATRTFSPTGPMATINGFHVATLLADGRVLVAGVEVGGFTYPRADIYDPRTGTFSQTGSMVHSCNCSGSPSYAPLLGDGRVLVLDEWLGPSSDMVGSAELFDPSTGTFSQAGTMSRDRFGMTTTLLADGRVLFAGDRGAVVAGGSPTLSPEAAKANEADRASAELYVP